MTRSLTRRRLGAGLAALTGITMGFPARAFACRNAEFGFYRVGRYWDNDTDESVGIIPKSQRIDDIFFYFIVWPSRVEFFASLYSRNKDILGSRYDLTFRFDDGTTHTERFRTSYISTIESPDEWYHHVKAEPDRRGPLFLKFMSAGRMEIAAVDPDNNRTVAMARDISLSGSSKAGKYAMYMVRDCPPGAQSDAVVYDDAVLDALDDACFLTTACVDDLGLADDCFELRTLRRFRDGVMTRTEQGRAQAALYRELAPAILAALPVGQRTRILRTVYGRYIVPSAIAARLGLNGLAHRIYVRLMLTMLRRFTPDLLHARRDDLKVLFGQQAP